MEPVGPNLYMIKGMTILLRPKLLLFNKSKYTYLIFFQQLLSEGVPISCQKNSPKFAKLCLLKPAPINFLKRRNSSKNAYAMAGSKPVCGISLSEFDINSFVHYLETKFIVFSFTF